VVLKDLVHADGLMWVRVEKVIGT
jgi:hypothetical protein